MNNEWKNIWSKRNIPSGNDELYKLIKADGFDSGAGSIQKQEWVNYVKTITKQLKIKEGSSVFEVGCGSGAFIYVLYKGKYKVSGIDYSKTLIELAKRVMPDMDFYSDDAINIKLQPQFDFVISNSVFQYFPDTQYALDVLNLMIGKAKYSIAVLDVGDYAKKELAERMREEAIGIKEYKRKYAKLYTAYYPRKFFRDYAKKNGLQIKIIDQEIKNYLNADFRYNVFLFKDS